MAGDVKDKLDGAYCCWLTTRA